ncbi:MAG: hypothetical protein DWQ04_23460, partial [Chloroflexi bacterium]
QAITFLSHNPPPDLHLILTSRSSPPLPLARLRARGELLEIRAADLRFTLPEATDFLHKLLPNLPDNTIAQLETQTEGWITGLQLAALSLQNQPENKSLPHTFSGNHHYVLDYLIDEVLNQQPEEVREFLLKTAVLDRLCAPLCTAILTGNKKQKTENKKRKTLDYRTRLTHLEAHNLFLIPLDNERRWFRYHHLFAEFLRSRHQQQASAAQIAALHEKAAIWYKNNNLHQEAIHHALAAKAYPLAATLITDIADSLWTRGSLSQLQSWLEQLPDDVRNGDSKTAVYHAWTLFFAAQMQSNDEAIFEKAHQTLLKAESNLPTNKSENRAMWGMVYAVHTALASVQADPLHTIQLGEKALDLLPEDSLIWRSVVSISLGFTYRAAGDISEAANTFANAARLSHKGGNLSGALFAFDNWATLLQQQGKLSEAENAYHEALHIASKQHADRLPITGQIHLGLGRLYYQRNQLTEAITVTQLGIDLFTPGGFSVQDRWLFLARLHLLNGDDAGMQTAVSQSTTTSSHQDYQTAIHTQREQALLWIAQQNWTAVSNWAQQSGIKLTDAPNPWREAGYLILVRLALHQGRHEEALPVLQKLYEMAQENGRFGNCIEMLVLLAQIWQTMGKITKAQSTLQEAVTLAQPGGYVRVFLDGGQPIANLLKSIYSKEKKVGGMETAVFTHLETLLHAYPNPHPPTPNSQSLIEPLSKRELEILTLIIAGHSNQQIADQLVVATSTIKWHINNIYGKLQVRTRTQAIARAHELKIL